MRIIYTITAGIAQFNFRINFYETKYNLSKNKLIKIIKKYLKNYLTQKNPEKIHCIINIKDIPNDIFIKKINLEKKYLLEFLLHENSFEFTSFYYLSMDLFDIILRNIFNSLLLVNHGLTLHASSCLTKKGAFVFLGESNSGKSTIAKLLAKTYLPLNDDMTVIRKIGDKFFLFQTPFIQRNIYQKKNNTPIHINSIFFIHKSPVCRLIKVKNKLTVLNNLIKLTTYNKNFLEYPKKDLSEYLKTLNSIIYKYDFYELYFNINENEVFNMLNNI
jgi:hypothetical protein